MQKKLLISYIMIIITAIGISAGAFWSQGYSYIGRKTEEQHLLQAKLLADLLEESGAASRESYESFAGDYGMKYGIRLTIIASDGSVLADSGKDTEFDNHGSREEVVKALNGESASVTRYSKTMQQQYAYSAVPVMIGGSVGVLRVSLPLAELKSLDKGLNRSIWYTLLTCLLAAVILAILFVKVISAPIREVTKAAERISEGDYGIKIYTREKAEIGRLAKAFNLMATNLKASMHKLTRRNIELEAMLRSMESGVVAIDEANAILFYNQAFAGMVGGRSKDYSGKSLYNVMRNAVTFEAVDAVRESGESEVREGYLAGGDNEPFRNFRVTAAPLVNEEHKNLGILLILDDVTQMKKLENIRTEFVSNVTHELKTPLTSIRGFIDTLKGGAIEDADTARRFLDIIDIEAERLYSLIQDILILSEIEQKKDYEVTACSTDPCIRSVIELLEHNVKEGVTIVYEPAPYIKPYYCNPDRMKQLIINLLDNAIKYTEKGTITVGCREEGEELILSVADTGIGMKQEDLPRIFERFYRVDRSRSRKQGGTGLGLSIVKHIVELYNGRIHVESKEGEGTVFEIRLPY